MAVPQPRRRLLRRRQPGLARLRRELRGSGGAILALVPPCPAGTDQQDVAALDDDALGAGDLVEQGGGDIEPAGRLERDTGALLVTGDVEQDPAPHDPSPGPVLDAERGGQ